MLHCTNTIVYPGVSVGDHQGHWRVIRPRVLMPDHTIVDREVVVVV